MKIESNLSKIKIDKVQLIRNSSRRLPIVNQQNTV